jgi:hypothetical protein
MSAMTAPKPVYGDLGRHPGANVLTGRVDKDVNRRITTLPFVRNPKRGEKGGRCFRSVKPTGNYAVDYARGCAWAHLVLPFLRYNVGAPLVSWIVADMIKSGEVNGLTLGFMRGLADELGAARSW